MWIYKKYNQDMLNEYIPLDRLARAVGYRYIFNDSQMTTVLQRGASYYDFSAFSVEVERPNDVIDEMTVAAGFMKVLYVEESYIETQFEHLSFYLPDVDFAVMLNQSMYDAAIDLFDYLMQLGGI